MSRYSDFSAAWNRDSDEDEDGSTGDTDTEAISSAETDADVVPERWGRANRKSLRWIANEASPEGTIAVDGQFQFATEFSFKVDGETIALRCGEVAPLLWGERVFLYACRNVRDRTPIVVGLGWPPREREFVRCEWSIGGPSVDQPPADPLALLLARNKFQSLPMRASAETAEIPEERPREASIGASQEGWACACGRNISCPKKGLHESASQMIAEIVEHKDRALTARREAFLAEDRLEACQRVVATLDRKKEIAEKEAADRDGAVQQLRDYNAEVTNDLHRSQLTNLELSRQLQFSRFLEGRKDVELQQQKQAWTDERKTLFLAMQNQVAVWDGKFADLQERCVELQKECDGLRREASPSERSVCEVAREPPTVDRKREHVLPLMLEPDEIAERKRRRVDDRALPRVLELDEIVDPSRVFG